MYIIQVSTFFLLEQPYKAILVEGLYCGEQAMVAATSFSIRSETQQNCTEGCALMPKHIEKHGPLTDFDLLAHIDFDLLAHIDLHTKKLKICAQYDRL